MSGAPSRSASSSPAKRFRAPGRVNIIGEHTDYNDGLVLPTTTALYTTVDATRRSDRIVQAHSRNVQDTQSFDLDNIEPAGNPDWIDYVKGVAAELQSAGIELRGVDLKIGSDIPLGGQGVNAAIGAGAFGS